ncbi:CaiB/BaiF CoA transferase family protein [Variovorax sp. LT1R20]|uniref:CaiB/BaiF CoA transferase family protein n=1 Tax=Variovorax sp. LT1R20 TaxID=3443729 RepID=UPI003F47ADD1
MTKTQGPLNGVRIADFTSFLSGPFATQILGDLGAEVIKIEPPEGDMSRSVPPSFVDGSSTYFGSANRNKKSVVLDLKSAAGVAAATRIIDEADAVVENFRPGKLAQLGLDEHSARSRKPSLVWASISGFGQDGPLRDRPAYDMIVQAMSGVMSLTGTPSGEPVRAGIPVGDLCAGLYAVIGLLSALLEARQTGVGRTVDVSMLDVQVAMLSYHAASYLQGGPLPGRQGSSHDSIPSYRCFRSRDGMVIAVTANTAGMFRSLVAVLGMPELVDDPRFKDFKVRYENRAELINILDAAFASREGTEVLDALIAAQVPAAIVDDLNGVFKNPQVVQRGMRLEVQSPRDEQVIVVPGDPLRFSPSGRTKHDFPPRLGEHTEEILGRA